MSNRIATTALALCLGVASSLVTPAALAQDAATAQALYEEGQTALAAGKTAEACNKFDASHRLIPTTVNLGALAACHEKLGRTASAAGEYERLAGEYRQRGKLDKEREARAKAAALEGKIPRLTVHLSPEARLVPGLEVARDDVRLESALLETALPVDPGSHTVTAKAPGFSTWVTVVDVSEGTESKELTVPGLTRRDDAPRTGADPRPPAPSTISAIEPTSAATTRPKEDKKGSLPSRRDLGLSFGVPGVVALALGVGLGVRVYGKQSDARDLCPRTTCSDRRAIDLNESARATYPFFLSAAVVGTVATAVGAYLLLTPERPRAAASFMVAPSVAPSFGGLAATGAF